VKVAREWFRLQVGQSLVPAWCACVAGARHLSVLDVQIGRIDSFVACQCRPLAPLASTGVLFPERRGFGVGLVWLFDIQGRITLITLFTSYSHVHLPFLGAIALNQQVGVLLLLVLVPALVGDAELATRCRLRAERGRVQSKVAAAEDRRAAARERGRAAQERRRAEEDRARAADEAAEERERAALRAQRQAQSNFVQLRHQLEPTESNAQRVRDVISLLEEYGGFA
jgi:hypothetical protein